MMDVSLIIGIMGIAVGLFLYLLGRRAGRQAEQRATVRQSETHKEQNLKFKQIIYQELIEFAKVMNPNIDITTSENQKLISGTSTTIVSEVRRAIEFGGSGGIHIPGEAETTRDLDKVTSWPNRCGVCGKEIQSTVGLFENNVRYCKDCYDKRSKEIE